MNTEMATVTTDEYFGGCPECGKCDGNYNVGKNHHHVCHAHKVRWCIGYNLFSGWQYETEAAWRRNAEMLEGYREVDPIFPTAEAMRQWGGDGPDTRLCIKPNGYASNDPCSLCGGRCADARVPYEIFPVNNWTPVCTRCADMHDRALSLMLAAWYVTGANEAAYQLRAAAYREHNPHNEHEAESSKGTSSTTGATTG